jgi:hypothetical protein
MRAQFLTPLFLLSAVSMVGCPGPAPETDVEGDDAFECEDNADNDGDGYFDCDDSDCFNAPACADDDDDDDTDDDDNSTADVDNDGYSPAQGDCDDQDYTVNPGADETCNDVDDDCDGEIDNDPVDGDEYYADGDGDGYGSNSNIISACSKPNGYVNEGGDCNDSDSLIHPGATETSWDGVDQDCDGMDFNGSSCADYALANALWWLDGATANISPRDGSKLLGTITYDLYGAYAYDFYSNSYDNWLILKFTENGYNIVESSATEFGITLNANLSLNSAADKFYLDMTVFGQPSDCEGYVAPTSIAFGGTLNLNVGGSGNVTPTTSLAAQWSGIAESNVQLNNIDGSSCGVSTFNTVLSYFSGFTVLSFFNDVMQEGVDLAQAALQSEVDWWVENGTDCQN